MNIETDRFGKRQPQFVIDYLRAFTAANPGSRLPVIWDRRNGWLNFDGESKRKSQIEAMTVYLSRTPSIGADTP